MKLHVDLDSFELIEAPGFRNPVGSLRFKRGDAANAEQQFKTAAALAPNAAATQLRLADFYLAVGKPDDAKRLLGEITTKTPDFLPAWRRTAEIAIRDRRLDDGDKALDVILKKNPSDLDGHLLLSDDPWTGLRFEAGRVLPDPERAGLGVEPVAERVAAG